HAGEPAAAVRCPAGFDQPAGTVSRTREPELKSFPFGAVKVKAKLLPVEPAWTLVGAAVIVPSPSPALAAPTTYGPTSGPPAPLGAAPAGTTSVVDVSVSARSTFSRPLPVSAAVPAASAFRANRPTMTPFVTDESFAFSSAAAPATIAAEADVPDTDTVPPPTASASTETPGAAMKASSPEFDDDHRASDESV